MVKMSQLRKTLWSFKAMIVFAAATTIRSSLSFFVALSATRDAV
jgi:hypothetical protein